MKAIHPWVAITRLTVDYSSRERKPHRHPDPTMQKVRSWLASQKGNRRIH